MKILVFSPHPDDAEAQMGGTIARYTRQGHEVLISLATIPNNKEARRKESEESSAILGARLNIMDLDPQELVFNRRTVGAFDDVIRDFSPDVVYTCWVYGSHQDHQVVAQSTFASTRKNHCSLYMYEPAALSTGPTPFTFRPQLFIDVTDTFDIKIKSLLAHRTQVKDCQKQWIDIITARSLYLGFQIHVKYAEAFEVVKETGSF